MKKSGKYLAAAMLVFLFSSPVYAQKSSVIPCGETVGVKIYTDGLLVVGIDGKKAASPAAKCGIKINDVLLKADGIDLKTTEQLAEIVNARLTGVTLSVKRNEECFDVFVIPETSEDGKACLGLWVRDSTAGIGTVTYINPDDMSFAALGHGICDIDTGNILSVKSGNILNCSYLSVTKSKKGTPGEISGSFENINLGTVTKNSKNGIFGTAEKGAFSLSQKKIPTAERDEICTGEAYILSDLDGSGVKKYEIQITKISKNADTKALVFKVTDRSLLEKAGGIVQGMSGAPIIQNDKLIGAVTHVFVNSPEKGYGIFIDEMINR